MKLNVSLLVCAVTTASFAFACNDADDGSTRDDSTTAGQPSVVDGNPPTPAPGTPAPGTSPQPVQPPANPSSPRGALSIAFAPTSASEPRVAAVGVHDETLYLTSDAPTGAPETKPWEHGFFRKCDARSCASTLAPAAPPGADLHYPATIQKSGGDLYVFGRMAPMAEDLTMIGHGKGHVLRVEPNGTVHDLGALFEMMTSVYFYNVSALGKTLLVDGAPRRNHGSWRSSTLLNLDPSPTVVDTLKGGEAQGWTGFATPTRLFAHIDNSFYPGALITVDASTGATTKYFDGALKDVFAFGERLGAIEWGAGGMGTTPLRQLMCESDTSCAAPQRHDLPASIGVDGTAFGGVVGDELVFFEATSGATTGSLRSCAKPAMLVGACAPTTISSGLPLPRGWGYGAPSFRPANNGQALFYVTDAGQIARVQL